MKQKTERVIKTVYFIHRESTEKTKGACMKMVTKAELDFFESRDTDFKEG